MSATIEDIARELASISGRVVVEGEDATGSAKIPLGDVTTRDVGTGSSDAAAGDAPANAVSTHEGSFVHSRILPANEYNACINADTPGAGNPYLTDTGLPANVPRSDAAENITGAWRFQAANTKSVAAPHTLVADDIGRVVFLGAGATTLAGDNAVGADGNQVTYWNVSGGTITLSVFLVPLNHTKLIDRGAITCTRFGGSWYALGTTEA